jgi:hypothetical protein
MGSVPAFTSRLTATLTAALTHVLPSPSDPAKSDVTLAGELPASINLGLADCETGSEVRVQCSHVLVQQALDDALRGLVRRRPAATRSVLYLVAVFEVRRCMERSTIFRAPAMRI